MLWYEVTSICLFIYFVDINPDDEAFCHHYLEQLASYGLPKLGEFIYLFIYIFIYLFIYLQGLFLHHVSLPSL